MTPKNFPGRKNQRRIDAVALATKKENGEAAKIELDNLRQAIAAPDAARAIRTKKDRSARGRIRSAA